jgi:transformation/transcription domain-associated protein
VVQALMESVTLSQPQPKFPPELIKFLAKVHSAWHVAIPLLETHVIIFPDDTRCFHALAELYRLVDEEDLLYGLWKNKCASQSGHFELVVSTSQTRPNRQRRPFLAF